MLENKKVQLRKIALKKRRDIHANLPCDEYSISIKSYFHKWLTKHNSVSVIGLYYPVNCEMSSFMLIDYLETQDKTTCLPIVINKNRPLIFKAWGPGKKTVVGHFGIPVPDNDQIVIPDLIICPLLAYDSQGIRLGYGGGFYDRTIRYLRKTKKTRYIGLAFSDQKSYHHLPFEAHDVPLDAVLTEKGLHNF